MGRITCFGARACSVITCAFYRSRHVTAKSGRAYMLPASPPAFLCRRQTSRPQAPARRLLARAAGDAGADLRQRTRFTRLRCCWLRLPTFHEFISRRLASGSLRVTTHTVLFNINIILISRRGHRRDAKMRASLPRFFALYFDARAHNDFARRRAIICHHFARNVPQERRYLKKPWPRLEFLFDSTFLMQRYIIHMAMILIFTISD